MLGQPLLGLASLTMILIIYFIADGIMAAALAFKVRPEQGWSWMLFSGVVSILLGISLGNGWPLSGAWAVGVLLGIRLIFTGWSMIMFGTLSGALGKTAPSTGP
jgi:uncharacterized membrane protein HdeD (DUF308 family)